MQVGLVGLGRMGGRIRDRLVRAGHEVIAYDADASLAGAAGVTSLEALVAALPAPRVVWVMVPAGEPTEATIMEVARHMEQGDVVIDNHGTGPLDLRAAIANGSLSVTTAGSLVATSVVSSGELAACDRNMMRSSPFFSASTGSMALEVGPDIKRPYSVRTVWIWSA